jgi:hypothetical protein
MMFSFGDNLESKDTISGSSRAFPFAPLCCHWCSRCVPDGSAWARQYALAASHTIENHGASWPSISTFDIDERIKLFEPIQLLDP